MAEYVDRNEFIRKFDGYGWGEECDGEKVLMELAEFPVADVLEVPQGYAYYTDFDDEHYLLHLTFPISEKQFKAIGAGSDLWETLRMGGESND